VVRAYRIGQARFLQWCFDELARQCGEGAELGGATRRLTELSFAYIDRISEQVIVIYEQERDRWLRNRATVRAARVRAVLEEREVDVDAAETTLGYRLRRRHLGLVAWVDEATGADQDLNRLERATVALGERVGAHAKPLFVPCDESSAWAWLALASDPSSDDAIPDAVEDSGIRAAFGEPGAGVDGFRRTHRQALMAERVALTDRRPGRQVIAFGDIGPVALMSSDLAQLRAWVLETLGALATDDEQHARLRTTVRVFLETGRSCTATAERLTMHKNTVHYRISKAEEIRGRPLGADRLGVEVALLACEQLGPGVLQR
jgi:DNA-binding PucR family transcriptional regulator